MATRSVIVLLIAVLVVAFACLDQVVAQEDVITLADKAAFKELERPPVKFDHAKHADKYPDCVQCHHTYEYKDGKKVNEWSGEGQRCSECHKLQQSEKLLPLRAAFHDNCTGCHRDLAKAGSKTGPATCGECHVKAK